MVDIETLGLEPGCALLSVGAVKFDTDGLGETFYRSVDLGSCDDAGLHIDAGTLDWWLGQDDAVTGVLRGGDPLEEVLTDFVEWFPDGAEVWANSPSFDCEILKACFEAVGLSEPWAFRDERDVRTIRALPHAVDVEIDGDKHDALDDAKRQALSIARTLARLQEAPAGGSR